MVYLLIIYGIVSFVLFYLLHHFFYKKAKHYSINKAYQKAVRWSSQSKPVTGGITFFISFILATIFYLLICNKGVSISSEYLYISLALIIAFFTGLADDMLSISPELKLLLQTFAAFILVYAGIYINIFQYLLLNYFLSMLWYIGIMNSINMLDNMDAIATSISILIASGLLFLNLFYFHNFYELIVLVSLIVALLTFLFFNYFPAKMYMGDNGSLFLGLLLGIIAIKYVWNFPLAPLHGHNLSKLLPFLAILLFFTIPLTDTITVTINRILKGKSPFIGGKDHTTHALYYVGLTEIKINALMAILQFISLIFALYLLLTDFQSKLIVIVSFFYCIFVVLFLYINALVRIKKNKDH